MNVSLYQAASALNANARWQEVISENMASSSIPGFKKQELSFEAVRGGMLTPTVAGGQALGQAVSLPASHSRLNFSPGEIKRTDVNTDFAIDGSAFFEVQLPNGSTAYTRDGEFKLSSEGQLVTKQGYLVMGDGGPIQLDPNNSMAISAAADGSISQGDQPRGKLNLVSFNDPNLLTPTGGGLFLAKDPALQQTGDQTSSVRQGFLEGSNTSPVLEMANLVSVMRAYEANQKVVQLQDERMSKAISDLGNPS
ncbi:MAG TPA: flagellar hook-basal body protein [Verrucomicrobiae bacterium]|nr:flagellar hook-basal body protein [Verrucomicrobiae bacterium]